MSSAPTISVVTPCLDQSAYIEATIHSVLEGNSAPDEYVVVDGASTDGSREIITRYAERLSWWVSEPDDGQYTAIQKGFAHTTGDVMAWLNAGDLYMPWTLSLVREIFERFPQIEWLTTQRPMILDGREHVVACEFVGGFARDSFRAGVNLPGGAWFARAGIQQESTFWRRSLWDAAGASLAVELRFAGDFELWWRFFQHANLHALDAPLAAHRVHPGQKTEDLRDYVNEAQRVLGGPSRKRLSEAVRHTAYNLLGRRPLRRLPAGIAAPLTWAGVLQPVQTVVWHNNEWRIVTDYAV
jgi:glycosyltransferase involved in cell wall biosynthesis